MPPVLGPLSPSERRLKSWAGASGTALEPSQSAMSDSSVPRRPSSTTTRRPPPSLARASATASSTSSVTSTPLPAARPSVLTTHGGWRLRRNSAAGPSLSNTPNLAVGTPASARTCFIHAFDPSRRAPSRPGPSTTFPWARSRSASPSTSGASGPTTNRSASTSSGGPAVQLTPRRDIPGLPGHTVVAAVRWRASASACSRPPAPTTQTLIGSGPRAGWVRGPAGFRARVGLVDRTAHLRAVCSSRCGYELLASGPHPHPRHRDAYLLDDELDVLLGGGGELVELGHTGRVLLPAGQLLIDGHSVVQVALVVGHVAKGLLAAAVGDAHLERRQRVEHVELGERHLGERVEPRRLADHHRVEPAGPPPAARVGAELAAPLDEQVAGLVEKLGGERTRPDAGDVRLGDPDHRRHVPRADTGAHARPARDRVGGCDERIGAVGEIQEGGLRAFEQDVAARGERLVDDRHRVSDELGQPGRVLAEVALGYRRGAEREPVVHLG